MTFEEDAMRRAEGQRQRVAIAFLVIGLITGAGSLVLAYQVAPVLPLLVASIAAVVLFVFTVLGLVSSPTDKAASFWMSVVSPTQRLVRYAGRSSETFWRFVCGVTALTALCWFAGRGGVTSVTVRCGSNALAVRIVDASGQVKNEKCDETRPFDSWPGSPREK